MTHWTGRAAKDRWDIARDWSDGVPGAGTTAHFKGGTEMVLLSGPRLTTGALDLDATDLTLASGRLELAPPHAENGNTFDLLISHAARLTIAADARIGGANVAQIGDGAGGTALTVLGTIAEEYGIVRGGMLDVSGGHWLSGDSGLFLDSAMLMVEAGGRIDTGGKLAQYPAAALDIEGNSTAVITGAGSRVNLANTFVSDNSGTSSLTVSGGAHLYFGGGQIGGYGDATLTVTGAGSLFSASRGITIGGQVPVNSSLTVTDHGTVSIGKYGLSLNGTLALDGTAHFTCPSILSGGGIIDALSGEVTLSSPLALYDNNSDPFSTKTTYLEAGPGATLVLSGAIASAIPNDTSEVLDAASGHIVLTHGNQNFAGTTQVYAATLEIAADDAAGTGAFRFVGGANHPATLQIDDGVAFGNAIAGFGSGTTIDLADFAFDHASLAFAPSSSGGTLTVANADGQTEMLVFSDPHLSAASFSAMSDGHGGTALIYAGRQDAAHPFASSDHFGTPALKPFGTEQTMHAISGSHPSFEHLLALA